MCRPNSPHRSVYVQIIVHLHSNIDVGLGKYYPRPLTWARKIKPARVLSLNEQALVDAQEDLITGNMVGASFPKLGSIWPSEPLCQLDSVTFFFVLRYGEWRSSHHWWGILCTASADRTCKAFMFLKASSSSPKANTFRCRGDLDLVDSNID